MLPRSGPAAYLDIPAVTAAAVQAGASFVHPGYGFLSENAEFVEALENRGIGFMGPSATLLRLFGDKVCARQMAAACGVPVLKGTVGPTSLREASRFFETLDRGGGMMIKAVHGGGGRGIRAVTRLEDVADAYARCQSEASASFGNGDVFVEELVRSARHVEVQIVSDRYGGAAVDLIQKGPAAAKAPPYCGLATVEFLVDDSTIHSASPRFFFIEVNPRLQVEHTVTEELFDVDLVQCQLDLARGLKLSDIMGTNPSFRRAVQTASAFASAVGPHPLARTSIQLRLNAETILASGDVAPSPGRQLTIFECPLGRRGVRVDTAAYAGMPINPSFDSLLAKVIVSADATIPEKALSSLPESAIRLESWTRTVQAALGALSEVRIAMRTSDGRIVDGLGATNLALLFALLKSPQVSAGLRGVTTSFVGNRIASLLKSAEAKDPPKYFAVEELEQPNDARNTKSKIIPTGCVSVDSPLVGTVVSISAKEGNQVLKGSPIAVMNAMKMETVVTAPCDGRIHSRAAAVGDLLETGDAILFLSPSSVTADSASGSTEEAETLDLDTPRKDLEELFGRTSFLEDPPADGTSAAGAKPRTRRRRPSAGRLTVLEQLNTLVVPGSFLEFGALQIAAQRTRRSVEDLIANTPRDGLLCGVGDICVVEKPSAGVNDPAAHRPCAVFAYDFSVLAGTQGFFNHRKLDRLFEVVKRQRLPMVCFCEGGGGRPGDTDTVNVSVAGLHFSSFALMGELSGVVPLIGIASGFVFAGNAALLAACDVIIATEGANIGMGGPAMIEGGGLGIFKPHEIGPTSVQTRNGVIDVLVKDDNEAIAVSKKVLSMMVVPDITQLAGQAASHDQRLLRTIVPENRRRTYNMRRAIELIFDRDSVLELRALHSPTIITYLARIDNLAVGVVANNPSPVEALAGAIDGPGARKASEFYAFCERFGLPIVALCDTPGFLVGPDAEKTGQVRDTGRMLLVGAKTTVPFVTVVLRKGVGLGAMAMAGGGFLRKDLVVSWPSGEFSGMGIEGSVRLGFKRELEAVKDPAERQSLFNQLVEQMMDHGKALSMAAVGEIDAVIDPADTRKWIAGALRARAGGGKSRHRAVAGLVKL
ncbi:biotin carboxylase [Zopfochytrium polystomum]|nr:biotin carboxylase [Zopfochytrium polystomum]